MARIMIFVYGVMTYLFMLVVFVYGMGFIGGFLTPTSLDGAPDRPLGVALALDLGLLVAFAVQHSGMARPAFKRWWTRYVPEAGRTVDLCADQLAGDGRLVRRLGADRRRGVGRLEPDCP